MNFYESWEQSVSDIKKNKEFTKAFLSRRNDTEEIFDNGTQEELTKVCKFLLSIPITNFIYCIEEDQNCTPDMVIQFSNFEHAIVDVARVLKFSEAPLTFEEIGKIIIKAREEGACKKYGENHSKLASELSMVKLKRTGSFIVSNTSFGDFSVNLSDIDRLELIKRLAIRNNFIKKIIFLSKKGIVNYMNIACEILSDSTAKRRKPNVRKVVTLILENNDLLNNIVW